MSEDRDDFYLTARAGLLALRIPRVSADAAGLRRVVSKGCHQRENAAVMAEALAMAAAAATKEAADVRYAVEARDAVEAAAEEAAEAAEAALRPGMPSAAIGAAQPPRPHAFLPSHRGPVSELCRASVAGGIPSAVSAPPSARERWRSSSGCLPSLHWHRESLQPAKHSLMPTGHGKRNHSATHGGALPLSPCDPQTVEAAAMALAQWVRRGGGGGGGGGGEFLPGELSNGWWPMRPGPMPPGPMPPGMPQPPPGPMPPGMPRPPPGPMPPGMGAPPPPSGMPPPPGAPPPPPGPMPPGMPRPPPGPMPPGMGAPPSPSAAAVAQPAAAVALAATAVALAAAAVAQPGMPPPPGAPPPPPPPGAPPSPSDMQQEEATPPCHATLLNSASNQKPAPPASAYQALSQEQRALLPGPFSLQERAKYEVGGSRAPVPAPVPVAPVATAAPCAPQLAAQAVPAPVGPPLPSAPQQQLAALAAPAVPTPVVPFVLVGGMLRPFIDQGEQPQAKRLRSVASDEASGGGAPHGCSAPGPSVDTPAALIEHSWTACSTSASRVLAAAHAHHTSVSGVLDASTSSGSVLERPKPATADSTLFYRAQLGDLVRFDGPSVQDGEEVHSALPAPTPQPKKVPSAWDGVSTPHACKHCKTSKVTCLDGMRPCARCVRLGYPCEETARPVKHACTNCSRAKIKCDRDAENDRCRRCQHLGLVCVPSQHNVSHQRRYEGPRRPMLPPGIFSRIAPATESTALAGAAGIAAGSTALVGPESTALLGAESTASLGTEATALAAARGTPQGTYQVAQPMPSTTRTGEQHEPWRKLSAYAFYALG